MGGPGGLGGSGMGAGGLDIAQMMKEMMPMMGSMLQGMQGGAGGGAFGGGARSMGGTGGQDSSKWKECLAEVNSCAAWPVHEFLILVSLAGPSWLLHSSKHRRRCA